MFCLYIFLSIHNKLLEWTVSSKAVQCYSTDFEILTNPYSKDVHQITVILLPSVWGSQYFKLLTFRQVNERDLSFHYIYFIYFHECDCWLFLLFYYECASHCFFSIFLSGHWSFIDLKEHILEIFNCDIWINSFSWYITLFATF